MMPKHPSFSNSCSATLSCSGERGQEWEKRGGPVVCKKLKMFGLVHRPGRGRRGSDKRKRPSKEEMEETKEGREVGVVREEGWEWKKGREWKEDWKKKRER